MTTPITLSILLLDDTAGEIDGDDMGTLIGAASSLLDELRWAMPVWPEHAQALAEQIGWEAPTDAAIEQALVCRAERAEAKAITTEERAVLHAARTLARAQTDVEAALSRWSVMPDAPTEAPEYARLTAARRVRNDAADRLYDVASTELAESLGADDLPGFLRGHVPAANGAAR